MARHVQPPVNGYVIVGSSKSSTRGSLYRLPANVYSRTRYRGSRVRCEDDVIVALLDCPTLSRLGVDRQYARVQAQSDLRALPRLQADFAESNQPLRRLPAQRFGPIGRHVDL